MHRNEVHMNDEERLKRLYDRIQHRGALTINDLAFLAKHDMDCCVRICERIVQKGPLDYFAKDEDEAVVEKKTDTGYKTNIDFLISQLNVDEINNDVFKYVSATNVLNLIDEPYDYATYKNRKYQYYNMAHLDYILNTKI